MEIAGMSSLHLWGLLTFGRSMNPLSPLINFLWSSSSGNFACKVTVTTYPKACPQSKPRWSQSTSTPRRSRTRSWWRCWIRTCGSVSGSTVWLFWSSSLRWLLKWQKPTKLESPPWPCWKCRSGSSASGGAPFPTFGGGIPWSFLWLQSIVRLKSGQKREAFSRFEARLAAHSAWYPRLSALEKSTIWVVPRGSGFQRCFADFAVSSSAAAVAAKMALYCHSVLHCRCSGCETASSAGYCRRLWPSFFLCVEISARGRSCWIICGNLAIGWKWCFFLLVYFIGGAVWVFGVGVWGCGMSRSELVIIDNWYHCGCEMRICLWYHVGGNVWKFLWKVFFKNWIIVAVCFGLACVFGNRSFRPLVVTRLRSQAVAHRIIQTWVGSFLRICFISTFWDVDF